MIFYFECVYIVNVRMHLVNLCNYNMQLTSVIFNSSFSITPSISVTPIDWLGKSSHPLVKNNSSVKSNLKTVKRDQKNLLHAS